MSIQSIDSMARLNLSDFEKENEPWCKEILGEKDHILEKIDEGLRM